MRNENPSIIEELNKAANGLLFMSESDYPIQPFILETVKDKQITAQMILEIKKHSPSTPVKTLSLEQFFLPAIKEESWQNAEEKQTVKRFQTLVKILKENLKSIKVFKVGKVEKDVYIVGKTATGNWIGLATKVIET